MAVSLDTGDIKFFYVYPAPADMRVYGSDLLRDPGLENAVLISLFSDARVSDDEILPDQNGSRRGWWGDALAGVGIGSKFWLSERSKIEPGTLTQQCRFWEDSLAWMIVDGLAGSVKFMAAADATRKNQINYTGIVTAPTGLSLKFRFFYNWKNQVFGGVE